MTSNPLHAAHKDALRNGSTLQAAFAHHLGTAEHPRGRILTLYRHARWDVADKLKAQRANMESEVGLILTRLQRDLQLAIAKALQEMVAKGQQSAEQQCATYRTDGADLTPLQQSPALDTIAAAWLGVYTQQQYAVRAALAGGDTELILGGDSRLGLLQPAPMNAEGSHWMAAALGAGFAAWLFGQRGTEAAAEAAAGWQKQAIPAIDDHTTDCCLRVAGQIQPLDEDFHLTGTPRYADHRTWAPFHRYCRTSIALYQDKFEDGITDALRNDARAQRQIRESGSTELDFLYNDFF